MEAIVFGGIGFVLGALLCAVYFLKVHGGFKVMAQDAVQQAQENLLRLAEENFKKHYADGAHDLDKRHKAISELVDPIGKTLKDMEGKIENLGKAGVGLETQLKTFSDIQNRLRDETSNLTRALRNPGQGGRWGEMHLQRTLEAMGLVENTHFRRQVHTSVGGQAQQPDFVLDLPSGLHIVVDVKTPMDPYLAITEGELSDEQRDFETERLKKAFRAHLADLSKKEYWQRFDSPDFVVMYLPSEGLFSMAVSVDRTLLEEAARKKIIIASPTTFMGLARIAHYGWQQKNLAEEARSIADLGAELYKRVCIFGEHMQKLGGNLNTAVKSYNKALGSLETNLMSGAAALQDKHVQTGGRAIPEFSSIQDSARPLTKPELLAASEDEQEDGELAKKRA